MRIAGEFMRLSPRARAETLALSKRVMTRDDPSGGEYARWKANLNEAARTLRSAGARPAGSTPPRQLADHERRNIARSAAAISKAAQAGHPAARTMAEVAVHTPRTSAPAHPNDPEYAQVLRSSGVRERYRRGSSTGGAY